MAVPVSATVVAVTVVDLPGCDDLFPGSPVALAQELGDGEDAGFPVGFQLGDLARVTTTLRASLTAADTAIPNRMVTMTNLQAQDYYDVYYVTNGVSGGTAAGIFSNYDGTINGARAMRIDRIGDNQPLYFESMDQDGIFQAGETWRFILQDCVTPPNPCFFYTPDEVGDGDPLPSIIVPEPAGLALSLLGGLLVLRRRR